MPQTHDPQALIERLLARDELARLLGVEFVEGGPGRCVVRMAIKQEHLNGYGGGHGGVIFSLADIAFAMASNSHGHLASGIGVHIAYFAGVKKDDVLYARAHEINRSRRLGTYRVDIERADGVLVAAFTGTVSVSEKPVEI